MKNDWHFKYECQAAERAFMVGRALVDGKPDHLIAKELNMAKRTVKKHVKRLCDEFGVGQRFYRRIPLAVKLYEYPIFRED